MGQAGFLKGNSVLQLLPSHLFTVIPVQVRFRIPALQGLRHNNAWHLAFSAPIRADYNCLNFSVVDHIWGEGKGPSQTIKKKRLGKSFHRELSNISF